MSKTRSSAKNPIEQHILCVQKVQWRIFSLAQKNRSGDFGLVERVCQSQDPGEGNLSHVADLFPI